MNYLVTLRPLDDKILEKVPLEPSMIVVHSTANPGASAEDHFRYLNSVERPGWAHYYADWDSISQMVPEGFIAPAQGPTYNKKAISIEMCEPSTRNPLPIQFAQFNEVWRRTVWLVANICMRYGWSPTNVWSHAMVTAVCPNETDHTDPVAFFTRYNKTFDDFIRDVITELTIQKAYAPAEAWQTAYVDRAIESCILSQRRHPNQPVLWWELLAIVEKLNKQKE